MPTDKPILEDKSTDNISNVNPKYLKYQKNIVDNYSKFKSKGYKNKWSDSDMNCIGGSCEYVKASGGDVPSIEGNGKFWSDAESNKIPVHVYANPKSDLKQVLEDINVGDFIGHNYQSGSDNRNKNYPEHSQVIKNVERDSNGKLTNITTVDSYGNSRFEKSYSREELEKGGPYGSLYLGRPTQFEGEKIDFQYKYKPENISDRYIPDNLSDTITKNEYEINKGLTDKFKYNEIQNNTLNEIVNTIKNNKENFIKTTGMSNTNFDKVAQLLPGIAQQETDMGNSTKGKGLRRMYGDFKDIMANSFKSQGATTGVFQTRERMMFDNPKTADILSKFNITKDNYNHDNTEQATIMAMVLMDNIDQYSLPKTNQYKQTYKKYIGREGNEFGKLFGINYIPQKSILGNNKDLNYSAKMAYWFNNPSTVVKGNAQGKSNYVQNVLNYQNLMKTTYPAVQTLPTLIIK